MKKENLIGEFERLQKIYGDKNLQSVYGGGLNNTPKLCLVFMNPTSRNIATASDWHGVRYPWLGTKQVWKFLTKCGMFDEKLSSEIQSKKSLEWTEEFCLKVYDEVKNKKLYITNLAKCTQNDARRLPDSVFKAYKDLLLKELYLVKPQAIILFGNQVSSIVLDKNISVSLCRKQSFKLNINDTEFKCFSVYYPVGNGFFNESKAVEDILFIKNMIDE